MTNEHSQKKKKKGYDSKPPTLTAQRGRTPSDHKVAACSLCVDPQEETVERVENRGRRTRYLNDPVSCLNTCPHRSPIWQTRRKKSIRRGVAMKKGTDGRMKETGRKTHTWFHGAVVHISAGRTQPLRLTI